MRAVGHRFEARPPIGMHGLRALYEGCKRTRELRQAIADLAGAQSAARIAWQKVRALGGPQLGPEPQVFAQVNHWRDKHGQLLSAELEFVSQASAWHRASDVEIAETLWPDDTKGEALEMALANVRQMKSELRRRNILV